MLRREGGHHHVGGDLLAVFGQGLPHHADEHRVHPPPLLPVEIGKLPVFGLLEGRDFIDGHIGDRQERAAPAAKAVMHFAAGQHDMAAVGQRAKAGREEVSLDKRLDRSAGLPFARRREFRQLHQFEIGRALQPPRHFHAIMRRGDVAEEGVGKINEHRVVPRERHDRAGVAEFGGGAEAPLALKKR